MASSNVSSLTDAQLRQAFIDRGFKPGPCIPSTRKVLETIYHKMQSGEDVGKFFSQSTRSTAPISTVNGVEDEEDQPVEQGRYSHASNAPRTPYNESMLHHPPVNTSTPTPSFGSSSRPYTTGSGLFNPGVVTPREPVKNTPVSTGGFDLRQRKAGSASSTSATSSASTNASTGGSGSFVVIFIIVLLLALGAYFLFGSSSHDDGDVGIPKISGEAPVHAD